LSERKASKSRIGDQYVPEKEFVDDLRILLKGDASKFSKLISDMGDYPQKLPSTKTVAKILGLSEEDARKGRRAFFWTLFRYSIGLISSQEITDYAELIGIDRSVAQKFCFALEGMSSELRANLKKRGLIRYVSEVRVTPHLHALGHATQFRMVKKGDEIVGIVPLVTVTAVAVQEGSDEPIEIVVELSALEISRLIRTFTRIREELKSETTSLSQKFGDIVLSVEDAEAQDS